MTPETIATAKSRYAALKDAGQTGGAFEAMRDAAPGPPDAPDTIVAADTIPGGWYWHGIVRRHDVLRVENPGDNAGVGVLLWSLADPSERLNPPDTIKVQWTAAIGRGRVLLSDMGRAMASVVGGPEGLMDLLASGSSPASNAARHGDPHLPSNADHFVRAAAKYGLGKRDVGPSITLFAPIRADDDGGLSFGSGDRTGRFDLRAEFDLIATVSNAPHPLSGRARNEAPIEVTVWRGDPPADDDFCLTATQEARWAARNTREGAR